MSLAIVSLVVCMSAAAFEHGTDTTVVEATGMPHGVTDADRRAERDRLSLVIAALDAQGASGRLALARALSRLASVLNELGEHLAAVPVARRALAIIRSRGGLFDEEQVALVELVLDAESMLGEIDAVADDLKYLERIAAAKHTADPLTHAKMLTAIAQWYCRVGLFQDGRQRYRQAIEVFDSTPLDDVQHLQALAGLGRCHLHELSAQGIATSPGVFEEYRGAISRSPPSGATYAFYLRSFRAEGERSLRAAALLAMASKQLDPATKLTAVLATADWFQMKGFTNTARDYYVQAHGLLEELQRVDVFDSPVRLLCPLPSLALRPTALRAANLGQGFVRVEFTVRADGSVELPHILERNVGKRFADEALEAVRASRYRPRFVAGKPVVATGVQMLLSFDDPRRWR